MFPLVYMRTYTGVLRIPSDDKWGVKKGLCDQGRNTEEYSEKVFQSIWSMYSYIERVRLV